MDVDGIPLGVDYHKRISDEVARCDVLIAAIGNRWIDLTDQTGQRRIDSPLDFVRIEISTALGRDIPLIPILLDGSKIPNAQLLPEEVKGLAVRNGLDVRHATFHSDLDRLVRELRQISRSDKANVGAPKPIASQNEQISGSVPWRAIAGGATILGGIGVLGVIAVAPRSPVAPPAATSLPAPANAPERALRFASSDENVRFFEKEAAEGSPDAMNSLGVLYYYGRGVAQDYWKAREWFEKAAAKDNSDAMTGLGVLYKNGQGVGQDLDKAREWFEKAAAKDNGTAMYNLGVLYTYGEGLAQDNGKAREWMEKAAAKGSADAKRWLAIMR